MTVENGHKELIQTIEAKLDDHFKLLKEDVTKTVLDYLEKFESVFDPENIKWVEAEGFSGPYERYPAKGQKVELSQDYKALLKWLKNITEKQLTKAFFTGFFGTEQQSEERGNDSSWLHLPL